METKKGVSRRLFLRGSAGAIAAALAASGEGKFLTQGIFRPNVVSARSGVVILAVQDFAWDAIKAIIPDFESATGLTIAYESGPQSGDEMLTKYSTAFAAGNSPVDVLSDADQTTGIFGRAGWLESLEGVIPEESWNDFPEIMRDAIPIWYGVDGVRYRFPHGFEIGYTWTRSDWLAEKGVSAPTTWEEVVEVGKMFTDPEKGIWGTTDGLIKGGLLYVYVAYLTIQAGGSVFDFDEGTGTALQFLYDMIYTHKIFPQDALNHDYTLQNQLYLADKVAFMRQWTYFQSVAEGMTDWYAPEKVKIELPPAGPAGSKSWWGGWGWSIPKFAPNMDGAKELIKFLTSNENAPRLAEGQSWFVMPRQSILAAFEGKDNPILAAQAAYSEADVPAPRPFHVKVAEAEIIVSDMASLFLSKQASLSDVLKEGKQLIKDLGE